MKLSFSFLFIMFYCYNVFLCKHVVKLTMFSVHRGNSMLFGFCTLLNGVLLLYFLSFSCVIMFALKRCHENVYLRRTTLILTGINLPYFLLYSI